MKQLGDSVMLRPGSKSYNHFIRYMPVTGHIINIELNHYQGKHHRPVQVKFDDGRTGWYTSDELVKR